MSKLSIIVPIYNGEISLRKCIDSILSQKFTDFELILVDDGSKDSSLEICREYAEKDGRIVVFHKDNAGLVAARKSGVEIATGEYIGFVDCDDYIDDDMYLQLMGEVEKNNSDIAACGILFDFGDHTVPMYNKIEEGFYDRQGIAESVIPRILINSRFGEFGIIPGVVLKVFKANIVKEALSNVTDNVITGEDVAITSFSIVNAESLSIINFAPYHYIQMGDSIIRTFSPKRFENICSLYRCICSVPNDSYQKQIPTYISGMIFGAVAECIQKSGYGKKEMKKYMLGILDHDMSRDCLKHADVSRLSLKDRIKVFLMRYKMIGILRMLLRG